VTARADSSARAAPESEGWRRNLYVIWLATFASIAGGNLAMPFIPLFINRELGVADTGEAAIWAGLATSSTGVAMAIMAPIWGALADRHGRKAMLVRAQFAIALSNAATSVVGTPWQLVALRSVQGGFSGVVGSARALVAGTVPRERVAYAMGLIQAAAFMGQTLGPAAGGLIGSQLGFRAAFLATGCINTVAGVLALLFVTSDRPSAVPRAGRRPVARAEPTPDAEAAPDAEPATTPARRASQPAPLWRTPLASLVAVLFLASAAMTSIRPIVPLLLLEIDPADEVATTSGAAFAALGAAGAVASLLSSRVAGRLGLRGLLILAALGGGVWNLAAATAGAPSILILLLGGVGICQGLLASSTTALVSLHAPAGQQGAAFGILTSGQALAVGCGPLIGALMASALGLRWAFATASALLLAAALVGATVSSPRSTAETG
jgi:MFS transporter, DHA1 family, multidrug resistance protein